MHVLAQALGVALSFMTRLGAPRMVEDAALARAVLWFGPVGLVVGLACVLPAWLALLARPQGLWAAAWLYVLAGLWITRALHWDGLADLGDAWGSGAQEEHFWRILRDSRLGAFGAMTLLTVFSGMLIAVHDRLAAGMWPALLLAPVFGRVCAVLLAAWTPAKDPRSLGGKACAGATRPVARVYALAALVLAAMAGLTGGNGVAAACRDTAFTLAGGVALLAVLRGVALRQGGSNGDFLGAAIVGGELLYLFRI